MLTILILIIITSVGVQSQRKVTPAFRLGRTICQSYNQDPINPELYLIPPPLLPTYYEGAVTVTQAVVPTVAPTTTVPTIPFITELPNCPDICFNEILTSPLGCLDPILNIYGSNTVALPVSPMLPSASPVSPLAPPLSPLLPPISPCDNDGHFVKRIPIPPPFI